MSACPKCEREHVGPRPLEKLIAEGARVIAHAIDMAAERAKAYLHSQWYGGALEIDGYCRDCIFATLAEDRIDAKKVLHGTAVSDEVLPCEGAGVVLPFRAPAKDAPHIGQTFDNGEPRR